MEHQWITTLCALLVVSRNECLVDEAGVCFFCSSAKKVQQKFSKAKICAKNPRFDVNKKPYSKPLAYPIQLLVIVVIIPRDKFDIQRISTHTLAPSKPLLWQKHSSYPCSFLLWDNEQFWPSRQQWKQKPRVKWISITPVQVLLNAWCFCAMSISKGWFEVILCIYWQWTLGHDDASNCGIFFCPFLPQTST